MNLYRLLKWLIFGAMGIFLVHVWLLNKKYTFSEDRVAKFARNHLGKPVKEAYRQIHNDMKQKFPGHILNEEDLQWIFMNAGGWMGAICLLHASLTEYVLFFGTAVDTVGHSGRYWANVSDTLLTGEFRQWVEGELEVHIHRPGDTVHHAWGEVTGVNFKAGTWMLEYGRGFIPSTLGFALADTIFSTQDFVTMLKIFHVYSKALLLEASTSFVSLLNSF